MSRFGGLFALLFVVSLSAVSPPDFASGAEEEGTVKLEFKGDTLSADIDKAPLRDVLAKFEKERGIWHKTWFKGRSTLNSEISVQFDDLSIKEGLQRILSDVNFTFVLEGSKVVGVMLFGEQDGTSSRPTTTPRRGRRRR